MFWIRSASETSAGVTLYERILSGSTQTFICRSLAADDRDLADAVDRFDAFLDLVLRDLGDFAKIGRRRDRDSQNRCGVGVELLHRRLFGRFGQIRDDGLDAVLDLLRRDVDVLFENELHENLRDAFDRSRTQLVDAADRVDGFLDLLGDLGLDLLRRCTGIDDRDRDRREIDLRKKIDAETEKRKRADRRRATGSTSSRKPDALHKLLLTTA